MDDYEREVILSNMARCKEYKKIPTCRDCGLTIIGKCARPR
jgi:tartrate dehydratase alpha subunit/fumarate hydratase class I-like protein